MRWFEKVRAQPWPIAIAASALIAVVALAGLVGLVKNFYVKELTDESLRYAVQLENQGSELEAAALDLRYYHRSLTLAGASRGAIEDFEGAYARLQSEIDALDRLGVRDPAATRPEQLREMANAYYEDFRPAIGLRDRAPGAFERASDLGTRRLAGLERAASQIDKLGERNAAAALRNVEEAENVERLVLLVVAAGLLLALAALAYSAAQMLRMVGELRELNARQQEAAGALEAASRAKTDFLADVSHELRTPLTVLRGNAELALETDRGGAHAKILEEIVKETGRMQRMIKDLLFLARSDAGSLPLEPETFPVEPFVRELAGRAGVLARGRGAAFEAELAGEGWLRADAARIEQAVLVLVDNAAKYGPKGESVTLTSSTGDGSLRIEVEDHGPGIPEAELPHVFERFYRVDKSRARKRGGAGLGLAIARTIVEAHGGSIEVESRVGQGTRMSVLLPLESAAPARCRRSAERAAYGERRAAGSGRVLVIEDDPGISDLLQRGLGSRGFEVAIVEDGSSGRRAWTSGGFDLVLLDVMLPGIDGVSLLAERRAAGDGTPVVLLTARDDEGARERGMGAGATDYIGKPFSFADLFSRVELLLSGTGAR